MQSSDLDQSPMTTLQDVWKDRHLRPTEVAGQAGISLPTLYKMLRKDPSVQRHLIQDVCTVLGITLSQYDQLKPPER